MSTQIVFLGSKPIGYQCLQYLLVNKEDLDIEVVGLRTRLRKEFGAGNDLTELAEQYNIPLLSSLDDMPPCDIIYSVQHHELLKAEHIAKAATIAVNLHLAPLPEYRGCNQFSFAIMDEAKEFGVTLHELDTKIDHGAILFEKRFPIQQQCWVNTLYEQTFENAVQLFQESIKPLLAGQYKKVPQAEYLSQRTTSIHYRNEIAQLKELDLNQTATEIEKRIRATYMPGFEPPYFLINGEKVYCNVDH